MTRSVIDPITRIEGHLRVEMEVENGVVADAWVSGGCFRGMELVVQNRTPEDAAQIVERICGVCPVSHAHASSIAGDKAYGITISNNARIVRNLLEGAQFLHSHILWLYNLAALDYVNPLNALQANVDDAYAVAENGLARTPTSTSSTRSWRPLPTTASCPSSRATGSMPTAARPTSTTLRRT
ncbi:MAG: nickel-dependent hydrogenase large subunit [Adlercreutzia sp.]